MINRREFISSVIASRLAGMIDPAYIPPSDEGEVTLSDDTILCADGTIREKDEESEPSIASSCSCTGTCRLVGGCPGWLLQMREVAPKAFRIVEDNMTPVERRNFSRMLANVPRDQWEEVPW